MLRITRLRSNQPDPSRVLPALEVAREAAEVASKVPGVKRVAVYVGHGGITFAGEADGYATADRILSDQSCQRAFGRLITEYGYFVESDEFLNDPEQIYPFLKR
jgi:hypothetical protein